ncbi:MAG: hypothetical protein U0271_44505 [Polyangiaceae bacterium]
MSIGALGVTLASSASAAESCEDAVALEPGVRVSGSTAGAALDQGATPCAKEDRFAAWYSFRAGAAGRYTVVTEPSDGLSDTTLAAYSSCGDAEPIACSDDTLNDLSGRLDLDLAADETVRLRVAGWGSSRGAFTIAADVFGGFERPSNDACADATPVTVEDRAPGTTLFATGQDLSSCGPEDSIDVWYSFTAPSAGDYTFRLTENMVAAHFVAVYDGCGGAELACGFLGASATLAAGESVRLRVGSNPKVADAFNLVAEPAPPSVTPPNDSHLGAIAVTVPSVTNGTTRGATEDGLNWGPTCGPFVNAAIWYSFVAPDDDIYVFDTNGSGLADTVVAVFDDCTVNGPVVPPLLACDDESGQGHEARLDGFLTAGTSVCIAVAGRYLSEEGDVTLRVSRLPPPPDNDHCEGAEPISIGAPTIGDNVSSTPVDSPGLCPTGNFPLWYSFTAPADGIYKFDTKASVESAPDIALYTDCSEAAALACSTEPFPAVDRVMTAGETVRVRVSTDVFWRGDVAVRVGPTRTTEAGMGGSGGASQVGGGGAGNAGGSGGGGASPGVGDEDGCACRAAAPASGRAHLFAATILALLALRRRPRRFPPG